MTKCGIKNIIIVTLIILCVVALLSIGAARVAFADTSISIYSQFFGGGDGSTSNPFLITNETELSNVRRVTAFDDDEIEFVYGAFKLANDIALTKEWDPIGNFRGTFYGNGKIIRNLTLNEPTNTGNQEAEYGLFSRIYNGTVTDLILDNVNITFTSTDKEYFIGSIAGYGAGRIQNCSVRYGTVKVNSYRAYVGGIVGYGVKNFVYNCENSANVTGSGYLGGIIGWNTMYSTVESSLNHGIITYLFNTQNGCAGGIAGKNSIGSSIKSCTNTSTIKYGSAYENNKKIQPCMAQIVGWNVQCDVTGSNCIGDTNYDNLKKLFLSTDQKAYCSDGAIGRND